MAAIREESAMESKLKRALIALERMQAKLTAMERAQSEPIAIISLGCRFADATSPEAFWQLLRDGVDLVEEIPQSRWDIDAYYDPNPDAPGKMYIRHGSFITDVDQFDPFFFGISPREAELMDPQQRLLLEVSWETLERAGIVPQTLRGTATGVFVGLMSQDYAELANNQGIIEPHSGPGNGYGMAAGRISHALGLQGPNLSLDTQCSSSLVAVHLAVKSLRNRECNLALAGGVNLILSPTNTMKFCRTRAYAPDGRCKTFDARADGTISSEGCGLILLKRLTDAEADGDHILAVIRGSAVNHDGASSGFTVPNQLAQETLIRQALADARVTPEQISYIEAHGTGTSLGDPIEVNALGSVFGDCQQPLWLGSVKTNLGHTDSAAGIAGLIKTVLALQHGELPAHLHFEQPSLHIPWQQLPFQVPTQLTPWPEATNGHGRLAGISSFGMSGTNAHVVVEEGRRETGDGRQEIGDRRNRHEPLARQIALPSLLTLSARDWNALVAMAEQYLQWLPLQSDHDLGTICHTTNQGRTHFAQRLALPATSTSALTEQLAAFVQGDSSTVAVGQTEAGVRPKIAFLFTGQGSQYIGMGQALYETQPVFRRALDECDEILRKLLGTSILDILYSKIENRKQITENEKQKTVGEGRGTDTSITNYQLPIANHLDTTTYTQPALFALEYALARLWLSWGIKPDVVVGHSVGEYVAACVAGVFSLADGFKLIAARGRLMGALPENGRMVAVQATAERVEAILTANADATASQVVIAAYNAPESIVISGETTAVTQAVTLLEAQGIKCRDLNVSHAFHSPLMEPMRVDFTAVAQTIVYSEPQIPLVSNLTGQLSTDALTHWSYWVQQIRQPVRFAESIATLQQLGVNTFIEVGPKPTLLGLARQCLEETGRGETRDGETGDTREGERETGDGRRGESAATLLLPSLRPNRDDGQTMLEALGDLYVRGMAVDWDGFHRDAAYTPVVLPTYPFQRQRYWLPESGYGSLPGANNRPFRPLIHKVATSPLVKETVFETQFSAATLPMLREFRVFDKMMVSVAAMLSMTLSAVELSCGMQACQLDDVIFLDSMVLEEDEERIVQLVLTPEETVAPPRPSRPMAGALGARAGRGFPQSNDASLWATFELISYNTEIADQAQPFERHVTGRILLLETPDATPWHSFAEVKSRCSTQISGAELYQRTADKFHTVVGTPWRWCTRMWYDDQEAIGEMHLPSDMNDLTQGSLHPGLLDSWLTMSAVSRLETAAGETYLPIAIETLSFYRPLTAKAAWAYSRQTGPQQWDLQLCNEEGQVIAEIIGFQATKFSASRLDTQALKRHSHANWLYTLQWQPQKTIARIGVPTPSALVTALVPQLGEEIDRQSLATYDAEIAALEAVSAAFVTQAFQTLGCTFQPESHWCTEELIAQCQIVPRYQRLTERLLAILAEMGILQRCDGHTWQVLRTPTAVDPSRQLARLMTAQRVTKAETTLLNCCGDQLAAVLQGRQDPLDLLFPNGDSTLATQLYQDSTQAQATNATVVAAVQHLLRQRSPGQPIRILEIGAGTGGTTAHLLPVLPVEYTDYLFTDIAPLFLSQAEEKFADYPFVRYARLDIEQDPHSQFLDNETFDLIIAANVIHATSDLRQTLKHIQSLLVPGGLLLLVEEMQRQRWVDLTFGLTEGWWRFQDLDIREDYPLLAISQWQALLAATGFSEARSLTEEAAIACSEKVLIAQHQLATPQQGAWLIFTDANGLGEALAKRLLACGVESHLVYPGSTYRQLGPNRVQIDPTAPADYRQLLVHADSWAGVIHLWSFDAVDSVSLSSIQMATQRGCHSTLHLVQALAERAMTPRLWLVTRGVHTVATADGMRQGFGVPQAPLWGMGKTIAQEHPEFAVTLIDLELSDLEEQIDEQQMRRDVDILLAEISCTDEENEIVWRDQRRYLARLAAYQGESIVSKTDEIAHSLSPVIHPEATYLITGGLGGLGLCSAQLLIEQGARQLILLGRSEAQPDAMAVIQRWAANGVTVRVMQVDVTKFEQLSQVVVEIDANQPLRGVIHATGSLDDGILLQQTPERFDRVLAAKVDGTWNLHQATMNCDLDFFILFSSNASLLGSAGQANHAAANQFLDGFAHYRRQLDLPALSINWGVWSEIGIAASQLDQIDMRGEATITTQRGMELLALLLDPHKVEKGIAQVAVLPVTDWEQFLQKFLRIPALLREQQQAVQVQVAQLTSTLAFRQEKNKMTSSSEHPQVLIDQLAKMPPKQGQAILQAEVSQKIKQLLKLSDSYDLDPSEGLFAVGMDSLLAIELRTWLQKVVDAKLPATFVFDHPSVAAITNHLADHVLNLSASVMSPTEPLSMAETQAVPETEMPDTESAPESAAVPPERLTTLDETALESLLRDKLTQLKQRNSA